MAGAEGTKAARKQAYFTKLIELLEEYPRILIVGADNVGSHQMQKIRMALRGKGVLLMGKNTMIRKAIRGQAQNNAVLENILPHVWGNVGFIFTKGDLNEVKKVVVEHRVAAPAKAGAIAPTKVVVPAGNTGMEPTQTSFLQALNIASKITKGQIEIINDVNLIEEGAKIGTSEATLLAKLGIKPFTYGLVPVSVYDNGAVYEPRILELTDTDILAKFHRGVRNVACVSLSIGYPTIASVPHSIARGFKNILAISLAIDHPISFTERLKNAKQTPAITPPPAATKGGDEKDKGKGGKPKEEEKKKKEEPQEEEDEDMSLSLFD